MELHVSEDYRLPTLTTVKIPPAVDGDGFRNHLLRNFGIGIGNGLGELSGKVWRIGLMGYNSSDENVDRLLNLFDTELKKYSIFETTTIKTIAVKFDCIRLLKCLLQFPFCDEHFHVLIGQLSHPIHLFSYRKHRK